MFFCDKTTHRLGLKFCPEVEVCIKEGLVAYTPIGRLACSDGLELPQAFGSDGGVTKVLWEQHATASHLKGKAWEASRDLSLHMANYASLLFDGQDILSSDIFNASSSSAVPEWCASPSLALAVTHSQKDKETCFDPIKHPEKRLNKAKSIPKSKEVQNKPSVHTHSNIRPTDAPIQSNPQAFNLWTPAVQSTPQTFNVWPSAINTDEVFKNHRTTTQKNKDVDMKDTNPKAKSSPSYHFTSDIQEMYDLDKIVQEKVNKTLIHLELGKLLVISAFLQKSVGNMTKMHHEYTSKLVIASIVEVLEDAD